MRLPEEEDVGPEGWTEWLCAQKLLDAKKWTQNFPATAGPSIKSWKEISNKKDSNRKEDKIIQKTPFRRLTIIKRSQKITLFGN